MKYLQILFFLSLFTSFTITVFADMTKGLKAYEIEDYTTAFQVLKPFAEQGNTEAQTRLGHMYYDGLGIGKDEVEAVKWYRKAAEQGDAEAQNILGWMYENGRGVSQDNAEAVKWYRKAAEQDEPWGQNALGLMYQNGNGVVNDDGEVLAAM